MGGRAVNDIVITGGTVIDGTGSAPRRADIGVRNGLIVEIGDGVAGRSELDASGEVVTPGFIDLHSHADFTLADSPQAASQLAQGVTTLVGGNCGHSPFPVTDQNRGSLGLSTFGPTLPYVWADLGGYAAYLEASEPAVNVALQVGLGAVRSAELGGEDRAPDPAELERMRDHVRRAAAQGAFGFSTGLIYPPQLFATIEEVAAVVAVAAECGLLYSTHVRNETVHVVEAVDEAIRTAQEAGARLEVSHLKGMGPAGAGLSRVALEHIREARAGGLDVACDVYPYTASSTSLASRLPAWALEGGKEGVLRRLSDPQQRARVVAGLDERFGYDIDPAGIVLSEMTPGPFQSLAGHSIVEVASRLGRSPAEAVIAVLAAHGDVAIVNHAIDEGDMRAVLADERTSVASDGWVMDVHGAGMPHPRSFGTFARVLHRYSSGDPLTLADAVRKMTSLPASRIGLEDRGALAEGMAADIAVFDPVDVRDTSTYADPWHAATGMHAVLVAGVFAYRDGTPTGVRGGRVLRKR